MMTPASRSDKSEANSHRIAVVIVNYRTPDLIRDCLETLIPEIDRERDVVIVVDNASGDDSAASIRFQIRENGWDCVRLVESANNRGFAAGNNVGIRSVCAEAYFLLNSDTLVRPGAVDSLWDALARDCRLGIVSPRLEWPDGTPQISCFRMHTPWSEFIEGSATGPIRSLLAKWDVPLPVSEEPSTPEWTSFAAVLVRSEVIDTVGLLDDEFFMYYEDVDFCRRLRQRGWLVRHEPAAHVVHLRGGTSPVKSLQAARKQRPRYYYDSRRRYFRQAWGRLGLLAANSMWTLGRFIAWLRETLGQKKPHTVDRELADIWRN